MFVCFNAFCILVLTFCICSSYYIYPNIIDPGVIVIIIIIIMNSQQIMEAHSLNLYVYSFDVGVRHGKINKYIYIYTSYSHMCVHVYTYVYMYIHT